MKKSLGVFFILLPLLTIFFSSCILDKPRESSDKRGTVKIIQEESYFVDYEIDGDVIRFRYAVCFENSTEYDIAIKSFSARFKKKEIEGWLDDKVGVVGFLENDQSRYLIQSGEKVDIIFVFEGSYLGGEVNEDLSFPEIYIPMYSYGPET